MTTQQAPPIAFSGSIPPNYDQFLGPLFFEPFALDMAQRLQQLAPSSLLEVAAGTGRLTRFLPEAVPGAHIVVSDINPAMIDFAKQHLRQLPAIEWHTVDAVSLPYADETFDCIASQFGVMFYSDRPRAYREAFRVLRPGGVFLFNAWDRIEKNPVARLTDEVLADFFPIDTPAFYKVPFSYHDEALIRAELAEAGFNIAGMHVLNLAGYAASPEHAARGLLEGTPVYTAIADRDPALLPAMKKTLAGNLQTLFGDRDIRVPLQARVVVAVKQ